MNRRWILPTLATAAATVAVIGGVMLLQPGDDDTPSATQPTGTQTSSPGGGATSGGSATGQPGRTAAVPVYFVGDTAVGPRLYREFQRQDVCADETCVATSAARAAVSGQPDDPDYRVPWPAGTGVRAVTWNGDVLTIDLSGDLHDRPSGMTKDAAELALQQLMYSAQAGLGKGRPPVQLLLGGKHSDTVLGVPSSEPLAVADRDSVLSAVSISAPTEGASVTSGFEVTGEAATFEATVVWELKQGDKVVRHGFTTAAECCTLSPYSFTVEAPPGDYTLYVHDTDESDGEGVGTSQDTKNITVR